MILSEAAVNYTVMQLLHRIDINSPDAISSPFEICGVRFHYASPDLVSPDERSIVIVPCRDDAWASILQGNKRTLTWFSGRDLLPENKLVEFDEPVPVVFWGAGHDDGSKPFVEQRGDGVVIFYADILATSFFMLTRWEETVVPSRDQHGRFPATASVAYKQGLLDRPIVDEYALILKAWLKVLQPAWEPRSPRFSVKLSHDIDHVYHDIRNVGRTVLGDLLKRYNPRQAIRRLKTSAPYLFAVDSNPYLQGVYELATLSEQHDIESAFYFMAAKPGPYDPGYDITSQPVARCMNYLRQHGHEIGFHPGYRTIEDSHRFAAEKASFDTVFGNTSYGGRQHYLRFRTPHTWRQWAQCGLTYDSTLSYADHEGFRCGTCHPYQPFDIERNCRLAVVELPLIVMDGTLKEYRGLTPADGEKRILTLAKRCKKVNGVFTFLWHNTSIHDDWSPWFEMYRRVLPQLAALEDQTVTLPKSEVP